MKKKWEGKRNKMDCENSIKIMEITQRFGDKTVLEDISLTLKKVKSSACLARPDPGKQH